VNLQHQRHNFVAKLGILDFEAFYQFTALAIRHAPLGDCRLVSIHRTPPSKIYKNHFRVGVTGITKSPLGSFVPMGLPTDERILLAGPATPSR
jgi:hypothetical protein